MKFETVLLQSFFAAALLICLSIMGAMLILPTPTAVTSVQAATATTATAG